MKISFNKNNCILIWLVWTAIEVLGVFTIETAAMEQMADETLDRLRNYNGSEILHILNARRILMGRDATHNRPYMVYLKPSATSNHKNWICGGVIVHEEYILTSASCIEDIDNFYVVSGTYKFSYEENLFNNSCLKNGAKKAYRKYIPKNKISDDPENDDIRWMNNDIAVVRVEDKFDFTDLVRGCDFIPRPVRYNNQSASLEEPGNPASIAGWGSIERINGSMPVTSRLLEKPVTIISKSPCKKRYGKRYHNIIENYMICTNHLTAELGEICLGKDCQEIMEKSSGEVTARRMFNPNSMALHSAHHNDTRWHNSDHQRDGGFCENDHGVPLVYGDGGNSVVIGIITACLIKGRNSNCHGPFLYTSVYKNRALIDCIIYKNDRNICSSIAYTEVEMSWSAYPDGPSNTEIKRKHEEEDTLKQAGQKQQHISETSVNNTNIDNTKITEANIGTENKSIPPRL